MCHAKNIKTLAQLCFTEEAHIAMGLNIFQISILTLRACMFRKLFKTFLKMSQMLRWYLSPSPNFFSDWLWPYCDVAHSKN